MPYVLEDYQNLFYKCGLSFCMCSQNLINLKINNMKNIFLVFAIIFISNSIFSQPPIIDGVVEKTLMKNRHVLTYGPVRQADIFWQKKIWRVIDVREKMNKSFMYPEAPFFEIVKKAAMNGEITLYSAGEDNFSDKITNFEGVFFERDTVEIIDMDYNATYQAIENVVDFETIRRFRIKELWYFNEVTSTLKVRILGIAPLRDIFDEDGNFRYEKPIFWIYYPHFRNVLARNEVYLPGNEQQQLSWDDLFEMRYFASTIYKEGNVYNRRIKDYSDGLDQLLEADKIKKELFNFEHDLWSY